MKKFKVVVLSGGGKNSSCFKHEHTVEAGNKKVLIRRLEDIGIINGREQVHIEELKAGEK